MNAFMIWSSRKRREISTQNPKLHNSQISKVLGIEWRNLREEEKQKFFAQAKLLNELHLIEHPDYKYRPKRRAKKKNIRHAKIADSHTVCPYTICHCERNGLTSSTEPNQSILLQKDNQSDSQQVQHNEATDPSEILIKKEKAESPTAVDSILSKDSTSGPGVGHINLHSRPSENPLFPTCERRDFAALKFSGHVAMLGGTMPPYHAANFHTESYRPHYHVLPYRFPAIGEKESVIGYPPSYSSTKCNSCPRGFTRDEECLLSQGTRYPFFNPEVSKCFYGRGW